MQLYYFGNKFHNIITNLHQHGRNFIFRDKYIQLFLSISIQTQLFFLQWQIFSRNIKIFRKITSHQVESIIHPHIRQYLLSTKTHKKFLKYLFPFARYTVAKKSRVYRVVIRRFALTLCQMPRKNRRIEESPATATQEWPNSDHCLSSPIPSPIFL